MKRGLLTVILWIGLTGAAWADGITAVIDKTEGTLEDQFVLTVRIEGRFKEKLEIPAIEGLEIERRGTTEQIQVVNGTMARRTDYNFIVEPTRVGEFVIPAISVTFGNEVKSTQPIRLRVTQQAVLTAEGNKDIYLTADLSEDRAFVGEQVIYTLRFVRRINATNAELDKPTFEGFTVETLGEPRNAERIMGGRRYQVNEIRFALFPNQPGNLTIEPANVRYEAIASDPNDAFARFGFLTGGRRVNGKAVSPAKTVKVLPLPTEGRPQNFSGLVGKFKLETQLSKSALGVGDSATLTVRLHGEGNTRQMPDLGFSADSSFLKNFKVYDDKPVLNVTPTENGLYGEKVFKKALVPVRAGEFILPPLNLSYFDPQEKRYVNLTGETFQVSVSPRTDNGTVIIGGQHNLPAKKGIEVLAEDLMPVRVRIEIQSPLRALIERPLVFGALTLSPPFLFFLFFIYRQNQAHKSKNVAWVRSKGALQRAQKGLRKAEKLLGKNPKDFYVEVGRILRVFVGEKLGINGLVLTPNEAAIAVLRNGAESESAKMLKDLLNRAEEIQFGGASKSVTSSKQQMADVEEVLRLLDKTLRLEAKPE